MPSETAQELFRRGNSFFVANDLQQAAECYRQALALEPSFAAASFNLGCTVHRVSGPAPALPHLAHAALLRPEWFEARSNLGVALAGAGRMEEAVAELEAASLLKPADARIRNDLGLALTALGKGEEAHAQFREAIRLDPMSPEVHNNLGVLFDRFGRTSEAIASFLEALRLRPQYPEAHNNLGGALKSQGRHAEALAHFREALCLNPSYPEAHSSLLFSLCYPAGISEEVILAEHRRFGAASLFPARPHCNVPSVDRPLRIGYVSADFRDHAVSRFIEPVLRHHDRSRFRVFCYANVSVADARSSRIAGLCDRFVNIAGVPDDAAEAMIRQDEIDILVDLSGHTAGNRLLLFARKPAPVQISWLGYPHTTGLSAVDYRITDAIADPPGESDRLHAERLLRVAAGFSCFAPDTDAPRVGELPALKSGKVTFGSFNNPAKITPETVALWAEVLRAMPGSRMLVKGYSLADRGTRERFTSLFAENGVGSERLELFGNTPSYRDHLALYHRVDIALDTYPYHGTTTTCEALWMGVPVVTLAGSAHRSRVGASLLARVGLDDLVAREPKEYPAVAVALAKDKERLQSLRKTLRQRMAASPLTDGARFARELEAAYREVWGRWCQEGGNSARVPNPIHARRTRAPLIQKGETDSPASPPLQGEGQREDGVSLDRRMTSLLAALRSDPTQTAALGGIEQVLNRQREHDLVDALNHDAARLGAPVAPSGDRIAFATLEEAADILLSLGFLTPAELVCRYLIDRGHHSVSLSRTLGEIALRIGQFAHAARYFGEALAAGDRSVGLKIKLLKAEEGARLPASAARERFLLIKAWGYGFWSDVNHVLGQILVAEMTGRTPIVHWGGNSLFSDDPAADAFEKFFQPVSGARIGDLSRCASIYPSKWNPQNLMRNDLNKSDGPGSRSSSLHVLERGEELVVSDFHYAVNDLIPWLGPQHHLQGRSTDQVCLYLFRRYLKVQPGILGKAERFYREKMAGHPHLALHVRGGDKGGEDGNLARLNQLYQYEIERYLQRTPQGRLFLLTDDSEILAGYLERYGDKVTHTGASRTGTGAGVHYQEHSSRYRLGEEVIVDALLALRCDAFIGNGLSNVSCAIAAMKEWSAGSLTLLGARLDRLRQITLYRS